MTANRSSASPTSSPFVATNSAGSYAVAWSFNFASNVSVLHSQRGYFHVTVADPLTPHTTGCEFVGMDREGNFIVGWNGPGGILAKLYGADGNAISDDAIVVTSHDIDSFAMNEFGQFVVSWRDSENEIVYAQRYQVDFDQDMITEIGEQLEVSVETTSEKGDASVAISNKGDFVVVWEGDDGDGSGVFARYFDVSANGFKPTVNDLLVNAVTTGLQGEAVVAMDGDGDFAVAWRQLTDGDIFVRRFNSAAQAKGSGDTLVAVEANAMFSPDISMDNAGNFVVTWVSGLQRNVARGQLISHQGAFVDGAFQVNTYYGDELNDGGGLISSPEVAMAPDGETFAVAWKAHPLLEDEAGNVIEDDAGFGGQVQTGNSFQRFNTNLDFDGCMLAGDFDDDCDVDATDIDILWRMVRGTGTDPHGNDSGDLNGSGGPLTSQDVDYLVAEILDTVYGDADLDDDVDGADFDAWVIRDSRGGGIGWATGDWDGDDDVDGADFDQWRRRLPYYAP